MLSSTGRIRVRAGGDYLNNTGADRKLQLQFKLGGQTFWDDTSDDISTDANHAAWHLEMMIQALGAGAQQAVGLYMMSSNSTVTAGTGPIRSAPALGACAVFLGAATTCDMTVPQPLVLNAKHSAHLGRADHPL